MKKFKNFMCLFLSLLILLSTNVTAVFAEDDSEQKGARGMYIRECVGYEPDYTEIDYTHTYIDRVYGDNTQGSAVLYLTYEYTTSGTTTASISGYSNSSTEANVVLTKMKAEIGVEVTFSRSWTEGKSAGVSYGVSPGKFEAIDVYIPAVKTSGRLKYKVYMDTYPDDVFYEYKTLNESYAPFNSSVYFKVISVG